MAMQTQPLVSRIQDFGCFAGATDAKRALRATLVALAERLRDEERAALAKALPEEAALALERAAYFGDFDREELYARVARHEGVAPGLAVEHAQIVCRALAAELPHEVVLRLRREVGESIGTLLEEREPIATVPRTTEGSSATLASGRTGSRHPLSEARYEPAHSASVARSSDPHGATKLSGAHGMTQERTRETLATGRPGAKRSIAETKD
jgi:uncharacterized protein (DUF2267 family)